MEVARIFFFILTLYFWSWATVTCPTLNCSILVEGWYQHSGTNPVSSISLEAWGSGKVCPLTEGKYAWINSPMQQYSSGIADQSQIYRKITNATCIDSENYFLNNLNNGRKCKKTSECRTREWSTTTCAGKSLGDSCSDHYECNQQLACRRSFIWPFESTCQTWSSAGSDCFDDYDCDPTWFCWYQTAADVGTDTKKCMTKFSAEKYVTFGWKSLYNNNLKDAIQNGYYCRSAWAYMSTTDTATCFEIQKITDQTDTNLTYPYTCDPTNTDNKWRYYADSTNYVETECEWGLDTFGYCPKPNQTQTDLYTINMKYVYGNSTCHTLDKDSLSAQTEWGIGNSDTWKDAVDYKFIYDNWPFLRNSTTEECIKSVFPESSSNIYGKAVLQYNLYSLLGITLTFNVLNLI